MSGAPVNPFPADALAVNQAGRLTDAQRRSLQGNDRSFRRSELTFAAGAAVIGIVLLVSSGPASSAWLHPIVAVAAFVIAGVLVVRSLFAGDSVSHDLSDGTVQSVDGAILKRSRSTRSSEILTIQVAGQNFDVGRSVYQYAPEAGFVRVYYLPRSHQVVNLELLPDRPLPAGLLDSPAALAQAAIAALRSHDPSQRAELMAEMATARKTFIAPAGGTAPVVGGDPRPLAEAIVGTWQTGPIKVTFNAGGTMTTNLPGGVGRDGQWSVDAAGQLHAQIGGQDEAGKAWVAGDVLTVTMGGEARQFQRVAQA